MEFAFDMDDLTHIVKVDFGDGNGKVAAHQHLKGGGWVAETATVEPNCYVGPYAVVFGEARVYGDAIINDYAKIYGKAQVYGNAKIYGKAQVYDLAQVYDNAKVSGNSKVYENSRVVNNALVYDNAEIYGNSIVRNNAEVLNYAKICGDADIYDSLKIYDNCVVSRKPKSCYGFDYNVTITDHHISLGCVSFPPYFIETTGKKVVRLMRYTPEQTEKWIEALKFIAEFHGCENRQNDIDNFNERRILRDLLEAKVGL
jgi:carbonic anhydrase/acetyltransferase-like protein (isoleucine patch superfamily)